VLVTKYRGRKRPGRLLHQIHYSTDLSTAVADAGGVRYGGRSRGTQMQLALDLVSH
jgi:hypothetical protein